MKRSCNDDHGGAKRIFGRGRRGSERRRKKDATLRGGDVGNKGGRSSDMFPRSQMRDSFSSRSRTKREGGRRKGG